MFYVSSYRVVECRRDCVHLAPQLSHSNLQKLLRVVSLIIAAFSFEKKKRGILKNKWKWK